jgi:hypothetical protein
MFGFMQPKEEVVEEEEEEEEEVVAAKPKPSLFGGLFGGKTADLSEVEEPEPVEEVSDCPDSPLSLCLRFV